MRSPPLQRRVELARLDAEICAVENGLEAAVDCFAHVSETLDLVGAAGRRELGIAALHTPFFGLRISGPSRSKACESFLHLAVTLVPSENAGPGQQLRRHLRHLVASAVARGVISGERVQIALAVAGLEPAT